MSQSTDGTAQPTTSRRKEVWVMIASLLLAGILAVAIYAIWNYDLEHPSTDDATVAANYVWIRPQIDGQIMRLSVKPNQFVKAGEELFKIDPRQYQQALIAAEKELVLVKQQNVAGAASVKAAQAQVDEQKAAVKTAQQYATRFTAMAKDDAASKLDAIGYRNALVTAEGKLLEMQADLANAIAALGGEAVQQARVEKAAATVALAKLKLEWTEVTAPADGFVTGMTLRVGDVVQADDQLFPFIESAQWWVSANFKETDVAGIQPGMQASVTIDIYGRRKFKAVVESLSSGSAASFSLLPPQNTTGNWVKVTQRIPVRVRLLEIDSQSPYRFGASAQVSIQLDAPLVDVPAP